MLSFSFQLKLNKTFWITGCISLFYIFSSFQVLAQDNKTANFIIVKTPSSLSLFNKYQQRLTSDQINSFPAGIPFQILKENELLSDGYSKATKVSFGNNLYFVAITENRKSNKAFSKYQNVNLFSDTVEVTGSNKIFFNSENQSPSRVYLEKGILLLRIFKDGQFFYARKLNDENQFGWIPSNSNYISKHSLNKNKSVANSEISDFLLSATEQKIKVINSKLEKLYSIYNQKENRNLPVPFLKLETRDKNLICSFSNLPNNNSFSGTQKYIQNEFEIVFLGSGYKISKTDNGFEITK